MKPAKFAYYRASSLNEAVEQLAKAGDDVRILAGGQSLVPMMNFRAAQPEALVDITCCEDLAYVNLNDGAVHIGSATTQYATQMHELVIAHCPLVSLALSMAGPRTIRNRGTVGGSLANGYPLAHLVCAAVCLEAKVRLRSPNGDRASAAQDFFVDAMVTDLGADEILWEACFPVISSKGRYDFRQLTNHKGGAAVGMLATVCDFDSDGHAISHMALSGVLGTPIKLSTVESIFQNKSLTFNEIQEAAIEDMNVAGFESNYAGTGNIYTYNCAAHLIVEAKNATES